MTGAEIATLFERLGRLVAATKQKAGDGTAWDHTFPNGETHRYVIRGLKSHAEAEDSAYNLLIWAWSAKDYLKKRAEALGRNGRAVEQAVNNDPDLAICADPANRLKHGSLDRGSRSGLNPRFGQVSFRAPQTAVGSLTFRAFEVEAQIEDPSQVDFLLPVLNNAGEEIGDAFVYAQTAILALERMRDGIEPAV